MGTEAVHPHGTTTAIIDEKKNVDMVTRLENSDAFDKTVSGMDVHAQQAKTPEEVKREKRFVMKIDLILIPLLTSMYFLASLDRGDVGNAAVLGMTKDLHLTPHQLSTCISIFYASYVVFQLPAYLGLKVINPNWQIGGALILWGLFNTVICKANSYAAVVGLRLGVGAGEAILQAGPLYLSFWYRRDELATRGALFFAASAFSGAFNGLISYAIAKTLKGVGDLALWRWLFLIEGVVSVGWGFVIFALLPPAPEKPWWGFSKEETEIAKRRTLEGLHDPNAKVKGGDLLSIFRDRRLYLYVIIYCAANAHLACIASFLPVIIRSFGYSVLTTQLLVIPVFGAAAVATVVFSVLSDRFQQRGPATLLCFIIDGAGWLFLLVSKNKDLSFAGCFLIAIGVYPLVTIPQVWCNNNTPGFTRKAGSLAAMLMVGQTFSIIGTQVYSDPPHYYRGNGFALGAAIIGGIATILLYLDLKNENRKKRRDTDTNVARSLRGLGIEDVGNKHPDFYYYL